MPGDAKAPFPPFLASALKTALPMLRGTLTGVGPSVLADAVVAWAQTDLKDGERARLAQVASLVADRLV